MRVDADDFARPCSCGREHQIAVKEILIEAGAVEKLEEEMSEGMLREYISPLVICDTNTYAATEELMEDIYDRCQVLVLDAEGLQADRHAIKIVENNMEEDIDLILAVGAGTIHDISRYIAHNYKVPFISVPTAASGDGFVTTVAAMTLDGVKKTVPSVAPICVYADTDIFSKAPQRLTAAGISDLMAKYICLADWKIANLVTGEYFCRETVKLEEKALKTVKSSIQDITEGEEDDAKEDKKMSGLEILKMHGIMSYAQTMEWKGPLSYRIDDTCVIDTSKQIYGTIINTQTLEHASPVSLARCKRIMTIENKANYESMQYDENTLYIFCHGYFTPKEVYFLKKLSLIVSKECEFLHWGDMDFGGISIFLFIKDRIFEKLMPYRMGVADFEEALKKDAGIPLKASTREKLQKKDAGLLTELKEAILESDKTIEQERLL